MSRLHADQIDTSADLVRRLVEEQFPQWATLPVRRVEEFGTDHHLYRLGDDLVARCPSSAGPSTRRAATRAGCPGWPPHLPVALPAPLAVGEPGAGYRTVEPSCPGCPARPRGANADRVRRWPGPGRASCRALHADRCDCGPPKTGRAGRPLAGLDQGVRRRRSARARLRDIADRVLALWEDALAAAGVGRPAGLDPRRPDGRQPAGPMTAGCPRSSTGAALALATRRPDLCPASGCSTGRCREVGGPDGVRRRPPGGAPAAGSWRRRRSAVSTTTPRPGPRSPRSAGGPSRPRSRSSRADRQTVAMDPSRVGPAASTRVRTGRRARPTAKDQAPG